MALGKTGRKLRRQVLNEYVIEEPQHVARLDNLCALADAIAAMKDQIDQDGLMVTGSTGQPARHPLLPELRAARALFDRLAVALGLPDLDPAEAERPPSPTSVKAARAASVRWARERRRAG